MSERPFVGSVLPAKRKAFLHIEISAEVHVPELFPDDNREKHDR